MRLFHRTSTERATEILRDGFKDKLFDDLIGVSTYGKVAKPHVFDWRYLVVKPEVVAGWVRIILEPVPQNLRCSFGGSSVEQSHQVPPLGSR